MATKHAISIKVADEFGSFGSLDPTTNLPAATAFGAAVLFAAEQPTLTDPGEPVMDVRDEARSGYYELPPEPNTVCDSSGSPVKRSEAQVTFSYQVRTGGDFASLGGGYDGSVLAMLLASGMQDGSSPLLAADYADPVSAPGPPPDTANSFVGTGTGIFAIGDLIAVDIDGKREYAKITDITVAASDTVFFSPAFSRALTNVSADVVRTVRTFSQSNATVGNSVAFQLDGDGWRANCYGCRWSSISWTTTPGRRLILEWTFKSALVQYDNASASIGDPVRLRGKPAHMLAAAQVMSAAVPEANDSPAPTAPYLLAQAAEVDVDEFACTITNTLVPKGSSQSILGMSDWEVANQVTELTLTLSVPNTAFTDDFVNQVRRMVMVGFGSPGAGQGVVLSLPGGVLKSDPDVRDLSTDLVRQVLTYGAGRWAGDVFPGGYVASNTPLQIGLTH